jgi:hypothetical protein
MPVQFAQPLLIQNPSKWDIIPVHASDRAAFKFCRRQWAWSSPSRLNLVPKAEVHGIRDNLWFGSGIHYALQRYYSPLREDPVITFQTWYELQWNGGLVDESELGEFYDRQPEKVAETTYRIRGLSDLLPVPDEDHYEEFLDLGTGMMQFYKDYAEANDNFTVIATEHDFSVPILDKDGYPLYAVDHRIMPDDWEPDFEAENAFGPLIRKADAPYGQSGVPDYFIEKQVHARGRMDLILQDNESGRYGIKDYKTAARVDDDYFKHLDLDEQCTTYLTLGEVEAIIHDLPYKKLEFIRYEALFKGYPKPPTITSRGLPSLDRQKESTTAEMFAAAVKQLGIGMIFERDAKMQDYYSWLVELGDKRFIWPEDRWRNKMQRLNARIRLYYEAIDMLNPDLVTYPNPTKNYSCINCVFRTPCLQAEDGSDYLETLEMGYESNWDR